MFIVLGETKSSSHFPWTYLCHKLPSVIVPYPDPSIPITCRYVRTSSVQSNPEIITMWVPFFVLRGSFLGFIYTFWLPLKNIPNDYLLLLSTHQLILLWVELKWEETALLVNVMMDGVESLCLGVEFSKYDWTITTACHEINFVVDFVSRELNCPNRAWVFIYSMDELILVLNVKNMKETVPWTRSE